MIYVTWRDANNDVIRGWTTDTCTGHPYNQIDFVDTDLDHGNIYAGSTSTPRVLYLTTRKFDGTAPTRAITNCKFFLTTYYESTQTQWIPASSRDNWSYCSDGVSDYKDFTTAFSGSATATADLEEIQQEWPQMSPPGGVEISVDKGCTYVLFSTTVGYESDSTTYLTLDADSGGSTVDGQIEPGLIAEVRMRVKVPSGETTAGIRQFLLAMQYTYSE